MDPRELTDSFNNSVAGSQTRKDVFRKIAENQYLILVKPQGIIWPKRYADVKLFSYTISTKQILIKNYLKEIVRKIKFADVLKIEAAGSSHQFIIIVLTLVEKNNPP